ncbi:MAG: S1 family peptidase [Gemmatimonadetes bacterium]|nr:S1 family peptidase [Gemmatimonadota bacterium]
MGMLGGHDSWGVRRQVLWGAGLLFGLVGCVDDRQPTRPITNLSLAEVTRPVSSADLDDDPHMVALTAIVPSFGGFYYTSEQNIAVAVTDPGAFGEAVGAVRDLMGEDAPESFSMVEVPFSFFDLASSRTMLGQVVFDIDGVRSLGVRESINQVVIGVLAPEAEAEAHAATEAEVRAVADQLDIPQEHLLFETLASIGPALDSLKWEHPGDSVQGGRQIQAVGAGKCTLGFPAVRISDDMEVAATNSHCTDEMYAFDGKRFGQPRTSDDTIGYEVSDPNYWTCGSDRCRNADAALIETTIDLAFAEIARPADSTGCESCMGSVEINSTYPVIKISGRRDYNVENETLHKVGRSTGWTYGGVEDTCHDYEHIDGYITKCGDRVDFSINEGDSGSPVFKYNGGVGGTAELRGVAFGLECVWGPFFETCDGLMSDLHQIELDLGSLVVDDDGPPTVSISGPDEAAPLLWCQWTANASGGSHSLSYTWSGLYSGSTQTVSGVVGSSGWINVQVEDYFGRTASASLYFTAGSGSPPECSI